MEEGEKKVRMKRQLTTMLLVIIFILLPPSNGHSAGAKRPTSGKSQAHLSDHLTAEEIRAAEQRLAQLGYWTGPVDGVLDGASRHALIAFQKVQGRKRSGVLSRADFETLMLAQPPSGRERNYAHVEVDLAHQVVFVIDDKGVASHILPISSGSGEFYVSKGRTHKAVTPMGKFTVCRKIVGWRKSDLGLLFYPNHICGGVAIHGSLSVPATPASHGCIRIPMFAAAEFSKLTPVGTIVVVYM